VRPEDPPFSLRSAYLFWIRVFRPGRDEDGDVWVGVHPEISSGIGDSRDSSSTVKSTLAALRPTHGERIDFIRAYVPSEKQRSVGTNTDRSAHVWINDAADSLDLHHGFSFTIGHPDT
jgi:hypothetical protein